MRAIVHRINFSNYIGLALILLGPVLLLTDGLRSDPTENGASISTHTQPRALTSTGAALGPDHYLIGFDRASKEYVVFNSANRQFQTLQLGDIHLPALKNAAGESVAAADVALRPVAVLPGGNAYILTAQLQNTAIKETVNRTTDPATGATIIRRTREETGYQQAVYFFEWSVGAHTVRANYRLPDTDTQYEDTARGLYKRLSHWSVLRADADGSLILLHYDAYNTHASQTIPGATFKMTLYRLRPGFTLQRIAGVERPIQVRAIGRRHIALLDYTEENQMMPGYIFDTESGSMVTIEVPPVPNAHVVDEERGVLIVSGTKFGGIYVYALSDGKLLRQAPSPGFASIWAMGENRVGFTTGYASTRFTYEVRDISSLNVIRQGPVEQFMPDFPAGKVTGYTICQPGHAQCVLTNQDATTVYLYRSEAANVPMVRTR